MNVAFDKLLGTPILHDHVEVLSLLSTSGFWDSTYSTVRANSASWEESPDINYLSGIVSGHTLDIAALSGDWSLGDTLELAYASKYYVASDVTLSAHLSGIDTRFSNIMSASGNWQSAFNGVNTTSGLWSSVHSTVNANSAGWEGVEASVYSTSGNWNSVHSTVNTNSGSWSNVYSAGLSGSRPTTSITGYMFFDTSYGYPIWWNGYQWVNATGANV